MGKRNNKQKSKSISNLFRSDKDWIYNACLDFHSNKWQPYLSGYMKSAKILANYVIKNKSDQDRLIYPIVFLYRHSMELALKIIIQRASPLLLEEFKWERDHDLLKLWKQSKRILLKVWPD